MQQSSITCSKALVNRGAPTTRMVLTPVAAALALAFGAAHTASAATITVGGGCDIVDAVISANSDTATGGCTAGAGDDLIVLSGGTYTLNTAAFLTDDGGGSGNLEPNSAFPAITSTITIQGAGSTIARGAVPEQFRLFYVDYASGNLSLESMTLSNGYANGMGSGTRAGGAVYSRGVLSLDSVTVTGNTASLRGGGVHSLGSVNISNSVITSNSSGSEGGGLGVGGSSSLGLYNTTISGNSAQTGGGLQSYASSGNSISDVSITGNTASFTGGGASFFNTNVTIIDSTVSSNSAGVVRAGGIQVFEGSAATLNTLSITGTTFNLNSGGFGLFSDIATTINGGEFNQNVGGGLQLYAAVAVDQITANSNTGLGIQVTGPTAQVTNCVALGNSGRGGTFYGSSINYVSVSSCSFNSNAGGGAILSNGSLTNVTITGNFNNHGLRTAYSTLSNVTVSNNSSSANGAGIYAGDDVTISNSTISGNSTTNLGGGFYITNAQSEGVQLIDTSVANNTATRGAGLYTRDAIVSLQNATISSNSATGPRGGGLSLRNGATEVLASTIQNNSVNGYGGGIYAGSGGTLNINSSTLSGNSAAQSGGAVRLESVTSNLYNSTFFANQATSFGGAVSARSDSFSTIMRNTTITANVASNGGGIETAGFGQSMLNLYSTIVANNTGGDCYNLPVDGKNNWFEDASCNGVAAGNPQLDVESVNASGEAYFSPLPESGVIDAGGQCGLETDQNGTARSVCKCDVGAVEILEVNPDNSSCKSTFFVIPTSVGTTAVIEL